MSRIVLFVALSFIISGCATGPSPEQQAAIDDAKCQGFGAARGSAPYVQCRTQLEAENMANRSRVRAAIIGSQ